MTVKYSTSKMIFMSKVTLLTTLFIQTSAQLPYGQMMDYADTWTGKSPTEGYVKTKENPL